MAYSWSELVSESASSGKIVKTFWDLSVTMTNDLYNAASGSASCTTRYACSSNHGTHCPSNKEAVDAYCGHYGNKSNCSADRSHNQAYDFDCSAYKSSHNSHDGSQNSSHREHNCVIQGTSILVSLGGKTRLVEDLQAGDTIVSYNFITKNLEETLLERCRSFEQYFSIKLFFEDFTLQVTESHPIYTDKGWTAWDPSSAEKFLEKGEVCIKLEKGQKVLTKNLEYKEILKIETLLQEVTVYNPQIATYHNYFANGILVHNKAGEY